MDFLKERIGVEVGFGHASFIGIDLFEISSFVILCSGQDRRGRLHRDHIEVPKIHEVRVRPELGGIIDIRKGETIFASF